jgi:acetolactate synthase-1/2/3 large subunit
MGYGLGAALGAKIANPKSPVVLFTGDGSFRMNQGEMATLVKYSLPVLIVILNNSTLGMLRQWQNFCYSSHYYETDLTGRGPDFIKLADSYGIEGFRVTEKTAFLEALGKCMKHMSCGKPALIEAIIDKDEKAVPIALCGLR